MPVADRDKLSFYPVTPDMFEFLRDESRLTGRADTISFPTSEEEIRETLVRCYELDTPVTVQGARTGITGGAVPGGGHILNLSRFNRILGLSHVAHRKRYRLLVQPGLLLAELNEALSKGVFDTEGWSKASLLALEQLQKEKKLFFPPDPTETGASLGGMAASNASGARSFLYGPTRSYLTAMRLVLPDGSLLDLRRGRQYASKRRIQLPGETGAVLTLPAYNMPAVKNAAGYHVTDHMDLIDLFVGAEGTLGVITELELLLLRSPRYCYGVMVFLPDEAQAVQFVTRLRDREKKPAETYDGLAERLAEVMEPGVLAALEYFDEPALRLLEGQRRNNPAFADLPRIPSDYRTAVYVEFQGNDEETTDNHLIKMVELMLECGSDDESAWMATRPKELARLKSFRHALPELVNLIIDERRRQYPDLTKLGTDMAVPDHELEATLRRYSRDLQESGLEAVKFGHIGNNHIHVNILPRNPKEYKRGKQLCEQWAKNIVALGGTVSAEHGIGKLKTALLEVLYGAEGIEQMRRLRRIFDPKLLLNRGNLFGNQ